MPSEFPSLGSDEFQKLAQAWIELQYAAGKGESIERYGWVMDAMDTMRSSNPEAFLDLLLVILDMDSTDFISGNLAAGPLEDLLAKHGLRVIGRLEDAAGKDDRVRLVLGGVWKNVIPDTVWDRVQALAVTRN